MARPKRVKQFTRWCVFCEKPAKMTSEHVWGDWLAPYLRDELNKSRLHHKIVGRLGSPHQDRIHIKAGGPLNSQVRVVCARCNNEWLSGIQTRAKPHMVPLIEGKQAVFGDKAQRAIATWATMAAMTGEYILRQNASIAVPQDDRISLMNTLSPLPDWRVWIGHYVRFRWAGHWVHACMPIVSSEEDVIPNVQNRQLPLPNTQWTTVMVGNLYVHVSSSVTSSDYIQGWHWPNAQRARRLLVQIWPPKESAIVWPPQSLSDRDAQDFSIAHFRFLHEKSRAHRFYLR